MCRIREPVEGNEDMVDWDVGGGAFGVAGLRLGVLRVDALLADDLLLLLLRLCVEPRRFVGRDSSKFPHATSPFINFCIVSSPSKKLRKALPGELIISNIALYCFVYQSCFHHLESEYLRITSGVSAALRLRNPGS